MVILESRLGFGGSPGNPDKALLLNVHSYFVNVKFPKAKNKHTKIKELFTPTQPAVNNSEGDVTYCEISPDIKLKNHKTLYDL